MIHRKERPECKRRWATEDWDAMQATALRDWLLNRREARAVVPARRRPRTAAPADHRPARRRTAPRC
ncbi:DUF7008 domain-containing protein [Micromonospora zamorensis]|uniref:DUF7008 domain-containing protein n=1 Tax=Micromonospora zamorensis TaxID=709883 RepID=UPI003F4D0581